MRVCIKRVIKIGTIDLWVLFGWGPVSMLLLTKKSEEAFRQQCWKPVSIYSNPWYPALNKAFRHQCWKPVSMYSNPWYPTHNHICGSTGKNWLRPLRHLVRYIKIITQLTFLYRITIQLTLWHRLDVDEDVRPTSSFDETRLRIDISPKSIGCVDESWRRANPTRRRTQVIVHAKYLKLSCRLPHVAEAVTGV